VRLRLTFHAARTYAGGDAVVSDSQLIVTGCAIPGVLLNWVVTRVSFPRATTKVSGTDSCGFLDELSVVMMTRERRAYDECSILDVRGFSGGGKELPRTTDSTSARMQVVTLRTRTRWIDGSLSGRLGTHSLAFVCDEAGSAK
jgi:hypothetical protein